MLQYVDEAVSRAKFEREIQEWREVDADYRARGWFLVEASYPNVMVLLATAKLAPPAIVTGVRLDYTNYDAEPPSVRLVNPFTGIPYLPAELPTSLNRTIPGQPMILPGMPPGAQMQMNAIQTLMQFHGPEDVPFLCLAGTREYHSHPGHSGDHWELHRKDGAGRLVRLVEIIHKYGVEPITDYDVNLVPKISFGRGQPPE